MIRMLTIIAFVFMISMQPKAQSYIQPDYIEKKLKQNYINYQKLNNYQKDFLIHVNLLKETHPSLVTASLLSDSLISQNVSYLKNCDNIFDFRFCLQKICAMFHDSHTYMSIENMDSVYPIKVAYFEDNYYIYRIDKSFEKHNGKIIKAINGVSVEIIESYYREILSFENDIKLRLQMNFMLFYTKYLEKFGLINGVDIEITLYDNSELTIQRQELKKINWSPYFVKSQHKVTKKNRKEPFSYKLFDMESICYFQFNSFYDKATYNYMVNENLTYFQRFMKRKEISKTLNSLPLFSEFLANMFKEIEDKNIQSLVIDLRNNGGGNSILGDQLLDYLDSSKFITKLYSSHIRISPFYRQHYKKSYSILSKAYKKEKSFALEDGLYNMEDFDFIDEKTTSKVYSYFEFPQIDSAFKGNVYFIQGRSSFSSTGLLLTKVSDNNIYTTIGEEISQKPTSYGDVLLFELPNTKLKGGVSHKIFYRPDSSLNEQNTLVPEEEIVQSFNDFVKGVDRAWDYILKLKK